MTTVITTFATEAIAFAASDAEQCAAAAGQAQELKDEAKYRRAREQLLICARDVCPGPIKSDCGRWLTEVDRDAPTVVLGARDAKGDLTDVKVSMDGVTVQEKLDGKPILVDAGEHTFTFESKDGSVKEEKVLLRAAEKARPIIVTFSSGGPQPPPEPPPDPTGGGSLVLPIILAGVAVVGLGTFAFMGLTGKGEVDDLEKSNCKPNCDSDKVDSARTKLIIADIGLVGGLIAGGVATYLFLTRPKAPEVKTAAKNESFLGRMRLDGGIVAGGAMAGLSAKF
ncbi:MAG: hypothetical protein KIT84_24205 [Labilithrix sp.]|nr:hypothetical protein [Labilithrix sp.]MCW5814153.1 hypothetical protein [Labilithrix sp.]